MRWVHNDYFLFLPNTDDPFTFTRKDGSEIRPGPMYTDVPLSLATSGESKDIRHGATHPHIVHDWLFEAHHCGYEPDDRYTLPIPSR